MSLPIKFRYFDSLQDYELIFANMKNFTKRRDANTLDEIWFLEHEPVFTQGQAGKPEHILDAKDIPIVQSDRGGQVTYHGPGQLMVYFLIDLKRLNLGIKSFVNKLESTVIQLLNNYGVIAETLVGAPGVYVNGAKICSIGLRVSRHCTYHGLSFNINMDLEPFSRINPCGFKNLNMTQLVKFCPTITISQVQEQFKQLLPQALLYSSTVIKN